MKYNITFIQQRLVGDGEFAAASVIRHRNGYKGQILFQRGKISLEQ